MLHSAWIAGLANSMEVTGQTVLKHGSQSFMLSGHSIILDLSRMTVFTSCIDHKYCRCIQLYPRNPWLGNSKRRCSKKGLEWLTFMITLQECKLKYIINCDLKMCPSGTGVSFLGNVFYSTFPVSYVFILFFKLKKTKTSWFQCHFGKWIFEGLVRNVWMRNRFCWHWEQNTVEFITEKIYSLSVATLAVSALCLVELHLNLM